ncbi:protein of unknown function DUF204 [Thermosinus carboxydivorans Nor1]|uniref:Manganese efflux pump MntP n=1 Tax=Thermosinus carboxydivorans Nor1 TaxID=401526 RepID=A1HR91_9FIRM|nr:manganese efflux pump [Thermosinus carboxydivorans]EAX47407.1 protein of unknown function DUF204 [Thermosinus carboxydivorans Nor1]
MSVLELFVLSAALGTDLFSVAVPIGMNRVRLRVIVQSAAVFALFHIIMILTGYYVGHWLGAVVEHVSTYHIDLPAVAVQNWASALGALVLAGLGLHMIKETRAGDDTVGSASHPLQGLTLVMLAVSVSIDALAAGFSLGMMDVDLIKLSVILGAVIFAIAVFGLGLGRRVGAFIGERAAAIGGAALIALGLHVLWTALW